MSHRRAAGSLLLVSLLLFAYGGAVDGDTASPGCRDCAEAALCRTGPPPSPMPLIEEPFRNAVAVYAEAWGLVIHGAGADENWDSFLPLYIDMLNSIRLLEE